MNGNVTIREETFVEQFCCYTGRLNRKRYIKRILGLIGIVLLLSFLIGALFGMSLFGGGRSGMLFAMMGAGMGMVSYFLLGFGFITIAGYSMTLRRLHDLNLSAVFLMLSFVPVVNFFFALYLLFAKGTEGDNKYGPDPLQVGHGYVVEWTGAGSVPAAAGAAAGTPAAVPASASPSAEDMLSKAEQEGKKLIAQFQALPRNKKIGIGVAAAVVIVALGVNSYRGKKAERERYMPSNLPRQAQPAPKQQPAQTMPDFKDNTKNTAPQQPAQNKGNTPAPNQQQPQQNAQGVITGSDVRFRARPSLNAPVLDYFQKGQTVQIIGAQSGWYQIKLSNGTTGWVSSQFCRRQ